MKRLLFELLLLVVAGVALRALWHEHQEAERLAQNQEALHTEIHHWQSRLGDSVASAAVLRLHCRELEELRKADAAEIRALGIRLRRAESMARTHLETSWEAQAPLRDTLRLYDSVRLFRWSDPWVEVSGVVADDSVECRVRSVDTLLQVVHRIPRRFLFIRWGTKALRQEILSKNPHTRIVYSEYLEIN